MTIWTDLERRIRERGVRVEERLQLLRALEEDGDEGAVAIGRRIEELRRRIEAKAREVKEALR